MLKAVLLFCFLGFGFVEPIPHHLHNGHPPRDSNSLYKLCVPEHAYNACLKMVKQAEIIHAKISCVLARDRMDCVDKIEDHTADWGAVEPEDMYVASKLKNHIFSVFEEIRTKEEPEMDFRYEAVAVIHKDLDITSLQQLRGLKSCHTGVGRNVGYKIPLTKLRNMNILPPMDDKTISPRENELKALSGFFSKACLVGTWSPDPETNLRLKSTYSNLCELCENSKKCDYPDQNSGYEGALRCLTKAGGEVAWTKVIYVKKFFGMKYGSHPETTVDVDKNDYSYFCPDGSKKPITSSPCTWAARPWPGYMANSELNDHIQELRRTIHELNDLGEKSHADWISSVLALSNLTLAVDNKHTYTPQEYLEKAKYLDVIERIGSPQRVKMCINSDIEKEKCEVLSKAAFSRDIRPKLECIQKPTQEDCIEAIKNGEANIMPAEIGFLKGKRDHFLEPIITEKYGEKFTQNAIAVVKKTSTYNSLDDLKGSKACLGLKGNALNNIVPTTVLVKKNLIAEEKCPHSNGVDEFFSAGVKHSNNTLKCLKIGDCDVAFAGSEDLKLAIDASLLNPDKYELICKDGGRRSVQGSDECFLEKVPARVYVANKELSQVERDDIMFTLLSASKLFGKLPYVFNMFGSFNGVPNVLFSNYASELMNNKAAVTVQEEFLKFTESVRNCPQQ